MRASLPARSAGTASTLTTGDATALAALPGIASVAPEMPVSNVVVVDGRTNTTTTLSRLVTLHQIEDLRRHLIISIQTVQSDLYTVNTRLGQKIDAIAGVNFWASSPVNRPKSSGMGLKQGTSASSKMSWRPISVPVPRRARRAT